MTAPKLGTLHIEVLEAEHLPPAKKKKGPAATLFGEVSLDADTRFTMVVPRVENPVWDEAFDFELTTETQMCTIKVIDGTPGEAHNQICATQIAVTGLAGTARDEWFVLYDVKKRSVGRIHLRLVPKVNGVVRLLTTTEETEEAKSSRFDVLSAPDLIKEMRMKLYRIYYIIDPLYDLEEELFDLFLWRNKVTSSLAFSLFVYAALMNLFVVAFLFLAGAFFFFSFVRAQTTGRAYVRSSEMKPQDLMNLVNEWDLQRRGRKLSAVHRLRDILALLTSIGDLLESIRVRENNAAWLGKVTASFLLTALFLLVVPLSTIVAPVARLCTTLTLFYLFTFYSVCTHYPAIDQHYSVTALSKKLAAWFRNYFSPHVSKRGVVLNDKQLWHWTIQLADPTTGVPIKTHKLSVNNIKHKFDDTFVAREAVDWLYANTPLRLRREAVAVLQAMIRHKAIVPVASTDHVFSLAARKRSAPLVARIARTLGTAAESHDDADERRPTVVFCDTDMQLWRFNQDALRPFRLIHGTTSLNAKQRAELLDPELSDREWKKLMLDSTEVTFKPDQVLIAQDSKHQHLFRIERGTARVVKEQENQRPVLLNTVTAGATLGELSALDPSMVSTAAVIANDLVTVRQCAIPRVLSLFDSEPSLCRKFFHTVALSLAERLDSLDAGHTLHEGSTLQRKGYHNKLLNVFGSHQLFKSLATATVLDRAQKAESDPFAMLFGVQREPVLVKVTAGYRSTLARTEGHVYVGKRFLGFFGKSFGRAQKVLVPLTTVKSAITSTSGSMRTLKVKTDTRKLKYRFALHSDEAVKDLMTLIPELVRKAQRGGDGGASATRGDESVARDSAAAAVASPSTDDAAATDDDAGSEKLKKRRRKKKKAVDEAIIANMDDVTSATALDASESMQESTGESVASILSTDDWKSMLSCSYVSYYTAGEAIVDRTRPPAGLLQIVSGKCRVERGGIVLGTVNAGSMLGEVSFVRNGLPTANVFAETTVEIQVICADSLSRLFIQQPALAGRAYRYFAYIIQERITMRQAALELKKTE